MLTIQVISDSDKKVNVAISVADPGFPRGALTSGELGVWHEYEEILPGGVPCAP